MKKIKLNKIQIKNFRNINELEISFNNETTTISGKNGLGKTNTLSAIMWCLFGKDINDTKQFPISPIINGVEDNSINTIVKVIVNDNYVIERSYFQRKTSLKTGWIIDGKESLVAITQTNYNKELIDNLVDEETFKSLSNINYIPNLHWKDLKKLIFDLIGEIKDEEVLLRDNFDLIEEYVTKFGIEQAQKLIQETDKELNEDIKRLETEYQTLLNTKEKYVANNEENKQLEQRKKELEDMLFKYQEEEKKILDLQQEYNKLNLNLEENNNKINRKHSEIEFAKSSIEEYENLYKENAYDVEIERARDIKKVEDDILSLKQKIISEENTIKDLQINLETIKNKGNELKAKEIKIEKDTCSTCGQKLPEESINKTLDNLKKEQLEQLEELKTQYDMQKEIIERHSEEKQDLEVRLDGQLKTLEIVKTQEYQVKEETEKQKRIRVAKEEKELELKTLEEELKTLMEENIKLANDIQNPKYCEIKETKDISSLRNELNEINNKLATTITLKKLEDDVNYSYERLQEKRNNKIINKNKMQEIIKFNNIKADLLKQKVRTYFDIVDFKTKEYTQSGEEVETFKICNDKGVEWKDINTGHKLLLGIDLLQGIQKAKELSIPIIIDGIEVMTNDINIKNTQIIVTRAEKGIERLEVK